jgi:hypothetical protein
MKFWMTLPFLFLLASCSVVQDAVDVSTRQAKQVPIGTVIEGDGFKVKTPDSGMYPKLDYPTRGGITFRPVQPVRDGMAYFVTPFESSAPTPALAMDDWNKRPERKGLKAYTTERKNTVFEGRPAHEAVVDVPVSDDKGNIAVILVVKRARDYLILTRGESYQSSEMKPVQLGVCRKGLSKLQRATTITLE